MKVIGIEQGDDGRIRIYTSRGGGRPGDTTVHVVARAESAWQALHQILTDDELPNASTDVADRELVRNTADDVVGQLEHEVSERFGPLAGRLASTITRDAGRMAGKALRRRKRVVRGRR